MKMKTSCLLNYNFEGLRQRGKPLDVGYMNLHDGGAELTGPWAPNVGVPDYTKDLGCSDSYIGTPLILEAHTKSCEIPLYAVLNVLPINCLL